MFFKRSYLYLNFNNVYLKFRNVCLEFCNVCLDLVNFYINSIYSSEYFAFNLYYPYSLRSIVII